MAAFPVPSSVAAFACVLAMLDQAEAIEGRHEGEPVLGVLAPFTAALHGTAAMIAYRIGSEPASLVPAGAPGNLSG